MLTIITKSRFLSSFIIILLEYLFKFIQQYLYDIVLLYAVDGDVVRLFRGRPKQRRTENNGQICRVHSILFAFLRYPVIFNYYLIKYIICGVKLFLIPAQ